MEGKTSEIPLISICVPAYNHEKYAAAAIRSVLEQDWPRIELLVIDDGSADGTWSVLQELRRECEERFERVVMERQENQGTCVTFSRLAAMAHGEYAMFLASDDMLLPGALSTLVRPMQEDDSIGLVVGRNEIMDSEGRKCFWNERQENVYDESQACYHDFTEQIERTTGMTGSDPAFGTYAALLRNNHIGNGQLIRSACLKAVMPFRREAPLEDWWLHFQLSKICRYKAVPTATFRYRWHAANTIKQREKMVWIAWRTLLWERDQLKTLSDSRWLNVFQNVLYHEHRVLAIGRRLGIFRREALDRYELIARCGGHERVIRLRYRIDDKVPLSALVIVHVYYPELWPELAKCIRNIDIVSDLVVTYSEESSIAQARQDFPKARFLHCENVGYDVWPFVKAAGLFDLSRYDFIIKLHTKRSFQEVPRDRWESYYTAFVSGDFWRRALLSFLSSVESWHRTLHTFERADVGVVANPILIAGKRVLGRKDPQYMPAVQEFERLTGASCSRGKYVMGTMCIMRSGVLSALKKCDISLERFVGDGNAHDEGYAHICERMLGLCAECAGLRVVGAAGSWRERVSFSWHIIWFAICRFVYRRKVKNNGEVSIKVCKIPVWRSRGK